MIEQKVKVLANGLIRGGSATIQASDTGTLRAAGSVRAGLTDFLSRKLDFDVTTQIDPKHLDCANLQPRWNFGYVHLVLDGVGKHAVVHIAIVGPEVNLKGLGYIDTTGKKVRFLSAHLTGSVKGHDGLTIDVVAE
jgi:hypothetical protein